MDQLVVLREAEMPYLSTILGKKAETSKRGIHRTCPHRAAEGVSIASQIKPQI